MRILHVTAQKPDSTGSGVYLAQTVAALGRLGHEQAIVCGVDAADDVALPEGVAVYPVRFNTFELPFDVCGMSDEMPYPSTRYRDLTPTMLAQFEAAFRRVLSETIAAFAPEVIVCNHLYLVTTFVRELTDELGLACPVVGICHNTCLRQLGQHGLERDRIIAAVRRLDLVLALHAEQRERILALFACDATKVGVIGTGFDASVFNCAPLPAGGRDVAADRKPSSLIFAGKVTFKKGVGSLFAALGLLGKRSVQVSLTLCGGLGPDYSETRLADETAHCGQEAAYLGKLAPADLAQAYRGAEVFVLPSFYEGLPLVVIEALACGCKVVVTDLPGLRPWIEGNIPDAPVVYVAPPAMQAVDEPLASELPAFEERLAAAIEEALRMPARPCDVSALSWDALGARLAAFCSGLL